MLFVTLALAQVLEVVGPTGTEPSPFGWISVRNADALCLAPVVRIGRITFARPFLYQAPMARPGHFAMLGMTALTFVLETSLRGSSPPSFRIDVSGEPRAHESVGSRHSLQPQPVVGLRYLIANSSSPTTGAEDRPILHGVLRIPNELHLPAEPVLRAQLDAWCAHR